MRGLKVKIRIYVIKGCEYTSHTDTRHDAIRTQQDLRKTPRGGDDRRRAGGLSLPVASKEREHNQPKNGTGTAHSVHGHAFGLPGDMVKIAR